MSQIRPPIRVKSVRRPHMDLVEEHRILNGHYRRLMNAKSVIDTSTPRSFHTNPRKKRQLANASGQSEISTHRSPSPYRSEFRSRSAGPIPASPDVDRRRNVTSPVKIVVSPSLDSTLQRSISRLDLHRSTSANRASSMTNLNKTNRLSIAQSRNRNGDVADRDFHVFNQPAKPFEPRLLLFNLSESKLAQQPRHYQPPFWKLKLQQTRAQKLGLKNDSKLEDGDDLENSMNGDMLSASVDARLSQAHISPNVSFRLGRGRLSPNTLGHLRPVAARALLFERVYKYNEQDEWRFMKEVTRDIVTAQTCSERILFHIFSQATKRWRNTLPVPRMRILLTRLMDDIQAPKNGMLSVYVEYEPAEHPLRKDASTITAQDQTEDTDYQDDEFEKESTKSDEIQSLADEDMEDLIEGKNLDKVFEKLGNGKKKQKAQKNKAAANETDEVSSIKSESEIHSEVSSKNLNESVQSASSDSVAARRSNSKHSKNVQPDEETAAEISDLEDDNQHDHALKVSIDQSRHVRERSKSLESSLSEDFHLDARPPQKLDSDDDLKEDGRRTAASPSREGSLKSIDNHELSITPASISKLAHDSLASARSDVNHEDNKSISSIAAQEIRQKRESFLKKLEEKSIDQNGDKVISSPLARSNNGKIDHHENHEAANDSPVIDRPQTPPKPQPRRRSSSGMVSASGVFSARNSRSSRQSSIQRYSMEEEHEKINGIDALQNDH